MRGTRESGLVSRARYRRRPIPPRWRSERSAREARGAVNGSDEAEGDEGEAEGGTHAAIVPRATERSAFGVNLVDPAPTPSSVRILPVREPRAWDYFGNLNFKLGFGGHFSRSPDSNTTPAHASSPRIRTSRVIETRRVRTGCSTRNPRHQAPIITSSASPCDASSRALRPARWQCSARAPRRGFGRSREQS